MISISVSDEKVKRIIKNNLEESEIVVDDLFTLSLDNCKNSDLQYCLICEEIITSSEAKQIEEYYIKNTDCYLISKKTFDRICSKQNGAGIILVTKIKQANLQIVKPKVILVCDGLEISGNIGTIFRTAEATNVDLIIFTNVKAKVIDNKIIHASRGMIFNVPFVITENTNQTIDILNGFNSRIIVCEPEQGIDYKEFDYSGNVALVVGSERYGVDKAWFNQKNSEYLKIKMFGQMDSLNVSVATSLILYEARYFKNKN